jgi:phosphoribosylanthranilate isomerase
MALPFRIKICGITRRADGQAAADAGADAVGLNFVPTSPRRVSPEAARQIAQSLPGRVCKVGVFVNADLTDMVRIAAEVGLDALQLHGDEPPEDIGRLGPISLIRAFRLQASGVAPLLDYLARCRELGRLPDAVLVDAFQPGRYGGTGQVADWPLVRQLVTQLSPLPVVLAGGLTPDNVGAAIDAATPAAVDTASGVESAPGWKDPALVRAFVLRAQTAFSQCQGHGRQADSLGVGCSGIHFSRAEDLAGGNRSAREK